jgi:hypothetical protein
MLRKLYPIANVKNAKTPKSDGFVMSNDWDHEAEARDHQYNSEKYR